MSSNPFDRPRTREKPHFGSSHSRLVAIAKSGVAAEIVGEGKTWAGHTEEAEAAAWDLDAAIGAAADAMAESQASGGRLGLGAGFRSAASTAAKAPRTPAKPSAAARAKTEPADWAAHVAGLSEDERDALQSALYAHTDNPTVDSEDVVSGDVADDVSGEWAADVDDAGLTDLFGDFLGTTDDAAE